MKHYRKKDGSVWAYEDDGSQDDLIAAAEEQGAKLMTDAEVAAHCAPSPVDPKIAARQYLSETDWYVTRLAETGKSIPTDVAVRRVAARAML